MSINKADFYSTNVAKKIDIDHLLSRFDDVEFKKAVGYNPVTHEYYTPKSLQNSLCSELTENHQLFRYYQLLFHSFISPYIQSNDKNFNQYFEYNISLFKYGQNDYIQEHDDCGDYKIGDTICEVMYSSLLYLNDCEGGELVVDGNVIDIKKGTFVVFPAEALHSVKPILSKERNAIIFRLYRTKKN